MTGLDYKPTATISHPEYDVPVPIFERDSSSSLPTDDKGCVICPSSLAPCPKCASNEQCQLRAQSCQLCSINYCSPKDSDSSKSTPVGGIVGGVIGGLVVLGLVAGLVWYYVYRKRNPVMLGDDDVMMDEIKNEENGYEAEADSSTMTDVYSGSGSNFSGGAGSGGAGGVNNYGDAVPPQRRQVAGNGANNRRRLSSYESFTRPKSRLNKQGSKNAEAAQRRARQKKILEQANGGKNNGINDYLERNNRNSVATSISTTNASNILPIAYIPGVTVRPTKNNTRSIYSYEADSIFSDLNTIENASIVGDVMRANNNEGATFTSNPVGKAPEQKNGTMTAIKAQPRLVNVDMIEEEEEDVTDEEDNEGDDEQSVKHNEKGAEAYTFTLGLQNTDSEFKGNTSLPNVATIEEEESDDSDVDSDIGEITRATSVRKNKSESIRQDREILLDIPQENTLNSQQEIPLEIVQLEPPQQHGFNNGSAGSFILDVEMDDTQSHRSTAMRPQSDTSGERSPFEDP